MPFTSDKRYFLTVDRSRAVEEGHPEAAFLLVGVGGELDDATAERYGLTSGPRAKDGGEQAPASALASPQKAQHANKVRLPTEGDK
jgi:hypothetical protein